jgi:hypothetical protein
MTVERAVRFMAGAMILLSLILAHTMGQVDLTKMSWLWFTVFIGLNLLQSSITGFCPPEFLFRKLGLKSGNGSCCG